MKKTILAILTACVLVSTAHAQTAVVVERPSLLSGLAETVGALVALPIVLPIAVAEGVVAGTAEAADALLYGTKEVYVIQEPQVVTPAPVVVAPQPQVVTPAPVVVVPQQVVTPAPVVVAQPVTTITTTTRSVIGRPAVPVVIEQRVGPGPHARPHVYRYR